ncbi:hypothetical protein BX600DRAFT_374194 [Xylariales sp. PMI_506]|nr:hypothetical protein BX600DRAFT_374194 [Xylariales sp. PMI_506]
MGVNGLWTVIQPCARPTNLATLNRKRLAIDASIWIYQFLKAVRDKEGNALRNSHVVGFFRRICKLLWFGIQPVFVFDGGAPILKRQTITGRKRRREGRREDAVRTAGKLLAVQMQRLAEEEGDKRRRQIELEKNGLPSVQEPVEEVPDVDQLIYVDELGMSQEQRQKNRKFYKQDAYHLPELRHNVGDLGQPDDPRIMSIHELEEYARQFNSGEDINLYDFSKIDFAGEFFRSLPPVDRYNILNAARVRSRLRMGLSKEQLDEMFPDRMAFSRFQIERVQERNRLTQLLMKEAGMTGIDLTVSGGARIAGEKDREYILVKNDGVEGGWALGVVSKEKDVGEMHKPIDVDALDFRFQRKEEEEEEWEDEDDFEDVPIEGLNRLPRLTQADRDAAENRRTGRLLDETLEADDDSLFLLIETNEEQELDQAIALSLKNQHDDKTHGSQDRDDEDFEDVAIPEWKQTAVSQAKPVAAGSGSMIARLVNNRANAAVPKRRRSDGSSDGDVDLGAALSAARKKKKPLQKPVAAVARAPKLGNPFGGPLPFEKLDWKSSIFAKKPAAKTTEVPASLPEPEEEPEDELAGGFERQEDQQDDDLEAPRPLPPWMLQDEMDIRATVKASRELEREINEEDREAALEEERRLRKEAVIEIESSDDDSDVEIIDTPPPKAQESTAPPSPPVPMQASPIPAIPGIADEDDIPTLESVEANSEKSPPSPTSPSTEEEFEDVEMLQPSTDIISTVDAVPSEAEPNSILDEAVSSNDAVTVSVDEHGELFVTGEDGEDEYSDPEDEELLAQMAQEAEEHARFASQLNNKSERENQESYERELKALRTQQKKDRRDADEVTQIMITECQALLRLFGIPYITAPMEAEAQCAELVRLGLVDGIVTDDSDIFLFGGTRVYKNMFNSNKFVECYLGSDLEKDLSLSREQLISLAQLLGSDYTEGLAGVGPVTAVEILSEFPGGDGLVAFRDWWKDVQLHSRTKEADVTSSFRKKFRKSQGKKLFLPTGFPNPAVFEAYMKPEVDSNTEMFQWGVPDVDGLRRFLMATIGWSQERTDEVLVPVIRDMNRREAEGTQSNITRYFEGSVGAGAKQKTKEAFAPRQRVQTSKRMVDAVNRLRANAGVENLSAEAPLEAREVPASGRKRKTRKDIAGEADDGDFVDGSA